jgi:mannosyltransferase OCH1-like enzyme
MWKTANTPVKIIVSLFFTAFFISAVYNELPTTNKELVPESQSRRLNSNGDIPRVAHFLVLGESPPAYMMEMVRVSMDRIRSTGFEAKLWRDAEAERLVSEYGDPRLSQSWEYVKADKRGGARYAKMADFVRPLIMFTEGGVYLDTDMIPCGSLDYMVDEPGVVSFPFLHGRENQVNGAAMSAPPGHPLMKMALDSFIDLGQDISWMNNLIAAGPARMGIVTDEYLKTLGMDLPPLFSTWGSEPTGYDPYVDAPEVTKHEGDWAQIADIRFSEPKTNIGFPPTYHLHFGSWIHIHEEANRNENICYKQPNLIPGFVDWLCMPDIQGHHRRFSDCGRHIQS